MANPTATPPNAPPGPNRLLWLLVGLLLVAVAVLVALLLRNQDADRDEPDVAPTPTEASPSASVEPSEEPSVEPTADAMPLLPPEEHFPESGVSAIPLSADALEDGDYFGFVKTIDVAGRTIDADIAIFYSGQAAIDYLTENDPSAENPPPNDYLIVNDVERVRTLDVSPDARIWDWCFGDDTVGLAFVERASLDAWAAAPLDWELNCASGAAMARDPAAIYWIDVRDGVVAQIIGQFLP